MQCIKCKAEIQTDFSFCEECGTPISASSVPEPHTGTESACRCGGTCFDEEQHCEECGLRQLPLESMELTESSSLPDQLASASHRGRHHAENQDCVGLLTLADSVIMAVADGVSTSCHARLAAATAIHLVLLDLQESATPPSATHSPVPPSASTSLHLTWRLTRAIERAHAAVCNLPHDDPRLDEPQTTLVVALIENNTVWYAWIGDSRLYLITPEKMDAASGFAPVFKSTLAPVFKPTLAATRTPGVTLLTEDDSWLNEQIRHGIEPTVAIKDSYAHCITQSIGMRDDNLRIHIAHHSLPAEAMVLLCSDGLWNYCEEETNLAKLIAAQPADSSLIQRCNALLDFANQAGGHDNITVALYRHNSTCKDDTDPNHT